MPDDGQTVCTFPAHRGKTLDQIASTQDGLRYLDWLVGYLEEQHEQSQFYSSLRRYLSRPEIGRAVEEAINARPAFKRADPKPKPWWEK